MSTQQKLKVVHVIGSLNYGGAENQVVHLLNGRDNRRLNKIIITFKHFDTANSRRLNPEIMRININLRRWSQLVCVTKLFRLFRDLKIDVVQAHMFHANLYTSIAAHLAGVPVVLTTEHGKNPWKRAIHHIIEKRVISPLVNIRVAVSKDIRDIRIMSGDIPKDKIAVIRNCVTIPNYQVKYQTGERLRIGTVGRMVSAKDYRTLITAFNILVKNRLNGELIFVGDGPELPELESMVQDLGIARYVTFAGFQENVNSFLSKFDIFVLSSIREGIPVAMLEAMAMRVPVVATAVGGIPEVIESDVNGLLVDSQNPDRIAEAINRLSKDPDLRNRIGDAGFKRVRSKFSREAICGQYEKLYFELFSHRVR